MFDNAYSAALLATRDITKSFGTVEALAEVSLTVVSGESVAVMGPSGSGKSTLPHCLSGVLIPNDGRVLFAGESLTEMPGAQHSHLRLSQFDFVFQDGQLIPELPARKNVALPLLLTGTRRRTALAKANEVLAKIGIPNLADRHSSNMSGRQAQRVAIARALTANPRVIFADEPNDAPDQVTGHGVMQLLTVTAAQAGAPLVMVTHDPAVARWCSRLVEIRDGLVHADCRLGVEVTR